MQKALAEALDRAPVGVVIVRDWRILWANERLAQWFGMTKERLVGLTPEAAEGAGPAALFVEDDTLCIACCGGEPSWLRRRRTALADGAEAHFFEDVTDRVRIEQERTRLQELVASLRTKDPDTGLLSRNAILQALEGHVSRSRRYGNALSMIRVTLEPPHGAAEPDITLREIAQEFNAQLRWSDQIGRLDETTFLLVLPETVRTDAEALASKLRGERGALASAQMWRIDCTVVSWQRGDDVRKLLQRLYPDRDGAKRP